MYSRCQRQEEGASDGGANSGDMDGQFGAPPFEAFISEPKRQEVTVGDSVRLQCTVRNRAQVMR